MAKGIARYTQNMLSSKQFHFLLHLLEFVAKSKQSALSTLVLPSGFFTGDKRPLSVMLTFNSVPYKSFVLVATLASSLCDVSPVVKSAIDELNPSRMVDSLIKAKGLFYFHVQEKNQETITLEDLSLELKSSGMWRGSVVAVG